MAVRLRAWSSLGGVLAVVLMVIGAILLFQGPSDSSPAKMTAWYQSSSHRTGIDIGWVLTGFALFFFVWFVGALREHIRAHERRNPANGTFLSTIVTVGGTAFVAVAMCVIGIAAGTKTMSDDTYQHTVYSGVIHAANDAAYVMLVTGGGALATLIFAASAAAFAFGLLPRWVGWFGVLAGIAAILSLFFFTMLVWLLWIAVVSVALFMRRGRDGTVVPAGAAAGI